MVLTISPSWSLRSVLISVRDLDHSLTFYEDVLNVHEVLRDGRVAVLSGIGRNPISLILRQASLHAHHPGQDTIGIRSLSFQVGSLDELDRIEGRLRALKTFVGRSSLNDAQHVELVKGHDHDRIALEFTTSRTGESAPAMDYERAMARIYAVDA
jgi:catechol-2,3-dioxygenase